MEGSGVSHAELRTFFRGHKRRMSMPTSLPYPTGAGDDAGGIALPAMGSSPAKAPSTEHHRLDASAMDVEARENIRPSPAQNDALSSTPESRTLSEAPSSRKARRRRRQSFNMHELDDRLREIAESGASPVPPMHGLPSPMVPMTPYEGLLTPTESAPMGEPMSDALAPRCLVPAAAEVVFVPSPLTVGAALIREVAAYAEVVALSAPLVDSLRAVAHEICTFAELWHWEEEARLARVAAEGRAPCSRFCAFTASALEPPTWDDEEGAGQHEAWRALAPVLHAGWELLEAMSHGQGQGDQLKGLLAHLVRFVETSDLMAEARARPFWRAQLKAISDGRMPYSDRGGQLLRSLVRLELRAVFRAHSAAEDRALSLLPAPRGGRLRRVETDSLARLLSNALRIWHTTKSTMDDDHVRSALVAEGADAVATLPVEAADDVIDAAEAADVISHVFDTCAFVVHVCADEHSRLRGLLANATLVPGWVDEFAALARAGDVRMDIDRARALVGAAHASHAVQDEVPSGVPGPAEDAGPSEDLEGANVTSSGADASPAVDVPLRRSRRISAQYGPPATRLV